jgi:hypothetical protein
MRKEICIFIQKDNSELGLKVGDTLWFRETEFWSDEIVYNISNDSKEIRMGSEVKEGRVFIRS